MSTEGEGDGRGREDWTWMIGHEQVGRRGRGGGTEGGEKVD